MNVNAKTWTIYGISITVQVHVYSCLEIKILPIFTHLLFIFNLYDFLSSANTK